jgi:cell division transport system permease protein
MTDDEKPAESKTTIPMPKPVKSKPQPKPLRSGQSIVPRETVAGTALIFVIGIMTFLACLTLGAVSMVNSSAAKWQNDISREVTIQIRPFDDLEMEKAIRDASRVALEYDGVSKVTALNDKETARLLEPWLGADLQLEELPVPRLLTVTLADGAKPDFVKMREQLEAQVPGSTLDDHRTWVDRLTTMALTMVAIGTTVFLLMMAATVTTVIFATRGAMAGNKDVVDVLHFVGADSRFISREFQKHFLILGLKGAACGALGAIILFIVLGLWSSSSLATPEGDQISALFGTFSLSWSGYLWMIAVLVIVALLTAVTSSFTVQRQVNNLQNYKRT